jgi:integrase
VNRRVATHVIAKKGVHRVSTTKPGHAPKRLTATLIEGLRGTGEKYDISDASVQGLVLRVGRSGNKYWLFRFKWNRKGTRITLGFFPGVSLATARERAVASRLLLQRGIDPRKAARSERGSGRDLHSVPALQATKGDDLETRESTTSLAEDAHNIQSPTPEDRTSVLFLAFEYVQHFVRPNRDQPAEVIRILNKDVLPAWRQRDARTITAREVIELLDKIVFRGAPVMANRTADILSQMFKYGVHRAIVENSPVQLLFRPGGKEKKGRRVFSDAEIVAFLHGLPAVCTSPKKVHVLRLLLLTAQRRSTLGLAEWREIDFTERLWRIPAEHDKERREHILPLSDWAISEFKELHNLSKGSRFVLPNAKGTKAASPQLITRSVTRLQERFQAIGIERFKTHDLRRTARTHMSKIGVRKQISERVLNHSMGEVEGTYDLYEYVKEKRAALNRWERQLRKLEASPKSEPPAETVMK